MATLKSDLAPIRLLSKREDEIGSADKVVYSPIKGKGEPFPKSYTVVLYGVKGPNGEDLNPSEPIPTFDIQTIEDDGVVQKKVRILSCESQGWIESKLVAIATASDVSVTRPS